MGRNLQPRKEDIIVQHEFMKTTQGMKWKVGGGTLKGEAFDEEYIKAGTAVAVDDDGDVVPFDTTDGTETGDEIGDGYLLANDVVNDKESNYVVGLIMAGYVDEDKITFDNPDVVDKFKENTEGRIFFDIA